MAELRSGKTDQGIILIAVIDLKCILGISIDISQLNSQQSQKTHVGHLGSCCESAESSESAFLAKIL